MNAVVPRGRGPKPPGGVPGQERPSRLGVLSGVAAAFIPVQNALADNDVLNEYVKHVSSGVFACPPGVADSDDYWGRGLFES